MNLSEIIRLYGKYILFGLIILLVCVAVYRGCRLVTLKEDYIALKSQFDALKLASDKANKEALAYIKTQTDRINELSGLIELKDKEIAEKYGNIDSLNGKLSQLEQELAGLPDKDAAIRNLLLQIGIYKKKCLTFEDILGKKDEQITYWKLKYDAQVGISDTWKKRFDDEHALRLIAEQALKVQEKRIGSLSFGSNFKTIVIVAVGGYLAYDLIKGK